MKTSLIALTVALMAAPAMAADLKSSPQRRVADDLPTPPISQGPINNHSGFYVSGSLGVAEIDRSVDRSVNRERGVDQTIPANATQAQIDATVQQLKAAGVDVRGELVPGGNIVLPVERDHLGLSDNGDLSSTVFGAEAGYLYAPSRIGFSLGVAATFYGDADSGGSHSGELGSQSGGTVSCPKGACVGTPSLMGAQSGAYEVDRDFDIDLIARAHFFVTDRLSINAGGGLSLARASISGASGADIPTAINGYGAEFDEDDTSIGYVLTFGADYWLNERVTIGATYEYKRHDFSAGGSSSASSLPANGAFAYEQSSDHVSVEDETHTIKAKIGFKLGGID